MCSILFLLFFFLFFEFIFLFNVYLLNLPNKQSVLIHSCFFLSSSFELPTFFILYIYTIHSALPGQLYFYLGFWRKLSCQLNRISISHCRCRCVFVSIVFYISIIITFEMVTEHQYECFVCVLCSCPRAYSSYKTWQIWRVQPQFVHKAVKDYSVYWAFWLPFSFFTPKCLWVYVSIAISISTPLYEKKKQDKCIIGHRSSFFLHTFTELFPVRTCRFPIKI